MRAVRSLYPTRMKILNYIAVRPLISHPLLAILYLLVLAPLIALTGLSNPDIIAALVVSVLFFGREAGPREHQLKRTMGPIRAWLGAEFCFLWTRQNWLEWSLPTLAVIAVVILSRIV